MVHIPQESGRPLRLLDQVREAIRVRHESSRTEEAYCTWIRRFVLFHGKRHPAELGSAEIQAFLSYLATEKRVSASTQNQALAALLFLYVRVLGSPLDALGEFTRAKRPDRVPVVLTPMEVAAVLERMTGTPMLMASLLYGAGLRLLECAHMRVKDVDLERREIVVRDGKGRKDRITMLPLRLVDPLRDHLGRMRNQHIADLKVGAGWVELPNALDRKYPNAGREWPWQWVFPATRMYREPETGQKRRHHLHETVLQRAVREAALNPASAVRPPGRKVCPDRRRAFADLGSHRPPSSGQESRTFGSAAPNRACSANLPPCSGRGVSAMVRKRKGLAMYLRHTTVRKNGKTHTYWRLVRSVRQNGKVVQQTVAQLGELDAQGRADARRLAEQITGEAHQRCLWEDTPTPGPVAVQLNRLRVERGRDFGNVWLGWTLWKALQLDTLCASLLPVGREAVPWATMAAVLVIARLCEPSSELHIAEDWYRNTALEDILGLSTVRVNDDRLYRALDQLLPHKEAIEQHLHRRLGELFAVEYDLLLYDITSTYFEGLAEKNQLAQRGHSRDHRSDCKQVCIALVVTREGLPLGYEVFAGNRNDMTTVQEVVGTMEKRFGIAQRIWVMDRGMGSDENLEWLRRTGRRYLVGTPKASMKAWRDAILEAKDWTLVRDGLEVKLCATPEGQETFVLCRSADRQKKEQAMHDRFAARIEEALARIARRLARAKSPVDRGVLERQIGRLLGRNARAAGRYRIQVTEDETTPAKVRLDWSLHSGWDEWARASEGCYVLRTNVNDWTPEELWRTYIQLTQAEAAFRIHKSELSIRPIWHQKPERVQAHILVCFLAYVLWKTLEQWQKRAGLGASPRTVLDELHRIQSTDVVLPTVANPPRELRLRCVVRPDPAQAALLDRLGLRLPERLRIPAVVAKV